MAYLIPSPTKFTTSPDFQSDPWISGFELSVLSDTVIRVEAGAARCLWNDFIISYPSTSAGLAPYMTADTTVTGPNGCFPYPASVLDTSTNLVCGLYIVSNSSGSYNGTVPALIIATGNDFLPPNYNVYRRIGLVGFNTTGALISWSQSGTSLERTYSLYTPVNAVQNGTSSTFVPVDLTAGNGVVPPKYPTTVSFTFNATQTGEGQTATFSADTTGISQIAYSSTSDSGTMVAGLNALGNASLRYKVVSGESITWGIRAFVDNMGNRLF